jgi:hypothetical protein
MSQYALGNSAFKNVGLVCIWVDSKTLLTYGLIKLGCPAEDIVDTTDRVDEPGDTEDGK